MLSKRDCLDYLNLNEDEISIIMERENLQLILAIKKCSCLLDSPEGILYLHTIFLDAFNDKLNYNKEDAIKIFNTYKAFAEKFPLPQYLSTR